ncbi:hypothetical protein Hanom_Chr13g01210481 [Helianthus anomalus]
MTAENLTKMADQVLMAKALEVDSKSASKSESTEKVSSSGSDNEPGKAQNAKTKSVCRGCMRECKVCNTHEYLSRSKIQELTDKISIIDREVIGRDKSIKGSTERIKELTEKIETYKNDVDSRWNWGWVSQGSATHGNNFTKKQSGLVNESDSSDKTDIEKLPENIDVTFNSQTDEDSIESEVVKDVEKVLKFDSDSTIEDDECFLNNYILKPKSQNNLDDGPTLVMYKMNGSDKLYSDNEFPIENVNVHNLKKVFKLVEIDVSEVEGLTSSKRFLNFQRDKSYYN